MYGGFHEFQQEYLCQYPDISLINITANIKLTFCQYTVKKTKTV